jgi:hypothetical protein
MCIVWWTSAQIQLARRFVSDMLAETDATFNTNEKRLLLQCFVGIDNTNSTFSSYKLLVPQSLPTIFDSSYKFFKTTSSMTVRVLQFLQAILVVV